MSDTHHMVDTVTRSVRLSLTDDTRLGQMARELGVSKNALIHSAVSASIRAWLGCQPTGSSEYG
jgi:hypothetical protein